ncbi:MULTISPECIES: hypothetical protein [Streptomyces]|uniref:Lipoprotein n=2 Tax=Streptomyces TaxID=1883 RepID=A0ABU4KFW7_9ACTN|nr:hypothetical protein [Streptomyces roseolus]MDX2296622.1 hypothetical protein [Streptomyces roseolus]
MLLLTGVAGCGSPTETPPTTPTSRATSTATPAPATPPRMILRAKDDPTAALLAALPGALVVTDTNCVAAKSSLDGRVVPLSWGYGWTARIENGKAVVYEPDGKVFAKEGEKVTLGGGTSGKYADHPCAAGHQVFAVNNAATDSGG